MLNRLKLGFYIRVKIPGKRTWLKLRAYFPSDLPVGNQEFEKYADSIIATFDLPDLRSYRHAVASMILHLGPLTTRKAKIYFAKSIRKAMANEVAFQKIQEYKAEEKEAASSEMENGSTDPGPRARIN